ncbi:MAG TPA: GAF domain-containing protein [bacterium]|nr:GAF domain-containing protein [bacterium]
MIPELLQRLIDGSETCEQAMFLVCEYLHDTYDTYDWVGFYIVDPGTGTDLVLGPYTGAPTDHTRIPFGTGVCGRVAEAREPLIVPEVRAESNYLACSLHVRSEIVVPVIAGDRLAGVLDIDSHTPGAFGETDRRRLEAFAEAIVRKLRE